MEEHKNSSPASTQDVLLHLFAPSNSPASSIIGKGKGDLSHFPSKSIVINKIIRGSAEMQEKSTQIILMSRVWAELNQSCDRESQSENKFLKNNF